MKKVNYILAILVLFFVVGCSSRPITFQSVNPKLYENTIEQGREITAKASGFQLLLLLPIKINDRHERALALLKEKANGDYITNVRIKESWSYAFIGTVYSTTITATAYPKK